MAKFLAIGLPAFGLGLLSGGISGCPDWIIYTGVALIAAGFVACSFIPGPHGQDWVGYYKQVEKSLEERDEM